MASLRDAALSTSHPTLALLPNGDRLALNRPYNSNESKGVLFLAVVSCVSATAVTILLIALALSAFNTRKSSSQSLFLRSHVAAYFISLLLCDVMQTVGSIMNIRWVNEQAVSYNTYCTAQAAIKHISDVGNAYWSTVIAANTFWILFLRWRLKRYILIGVMVGGWSTIAAFVASGPAAIQTVSKGPFYAISGYWCWVSDEYPGSRITLDYMIMFIAAMYSFIMYTLVFLKLRGNILVHGWRLTFHFRGNPYETHPNAVDPHVIGVAKKMLLYPVAYTVLLLPIAACRFAEWTGHVVPFAVTIICDSIFLLSGFVNVVLFFTTRHVLPIHSVVPHGISQLFRSPTRSTLQMSSYTMTSSYAVADAEKGTASSARSPVSPVFNAACALESPVLAIGCAPRAGVCNVDGNSTSSAEVPVVGSSFGNGVVAVSNPKIPPRASSSPRVAHG